MKRNASSLQSRITGVASVDRRLALLESKVARRIVRKSTTAGLKVVSDAIRAEIKAAPISPQLKRSLARTVGRRFKKSRKTGQLEAKAGVAVGKKTKPLTRSGRNKGGVGIGPRNVHWFVLGTKNRTVKKTRQSSGRIKAVPVVAGAGQKAGPAARSTMERVAMQEIKQALR